MGRFFFITIAILFGGLLLGGPVLAAPDTISVTAVVPEMRVIYLDSDGDIQKIAGNTAENIVPTVMQDDRPAILSDKAAAQYSRVLTENGGALAAGQVYLSDKYSPYKKLAAWILDNPVFNSRLY